MKPISSTLQPSPLDIALGQRIRARRKGLGVSQTALADAIGLTFQQIQKYERGFNRVSFSRLVDIAHALDCRVVELIGDLDDSNVSQPNFRNDAAHLRVEGGPELLAAYAAAPRRLQHVIRKLVMALAEERQGRPSQGDDQVTLSP
jgi:transcriptional regulator with XRE-family HTH domain